MTSPRTLSVETEAILGTTLWFIGVAGMIATVLLNLTNGIDTHTPRFIAGLFLTFALLNLGGGVFLISVIYRISDDDWTTNSGD